MRVLGIDPGTRVAGYGVIEWKDGMASPQALAAGAWSLGAKSELAARLGCLAIEFRRVVETYKPTHLCVELSFMADNPRTALFLGHARGVVLAEGFLCQLVIQEISATSAKKIISGRGRADKASIAKIMESLLRQNLQALPFDATDALAIAYACLIQQKEKLMQMPITPLQENDQQKKRQEALNIWANASSQKKSRRQIKSGFEELLKARQG